MDAIRVEGLTKRYGDVLAVDAIGFRVPPGETVGLLGGNGAGKTTTIAMLLGLLIPTAGRIAVLGHDMASDRFAALAELVREVSTDEALRRRILAGQAKRLPRVRAMYSVQMTG